MNWGNKLILVFIAFATLIATLVYKSVNTKFELVSKDYYKEELRFQDKIDGKNNVAKLSSIQLIQTENLITLKLPKELIGYHVTGNILFYCPTNALNDINKTLLVNSNNEQFFLVKDFVPENYIVKISWQIGKDLYYAENKLQIKHL
jgi:hypothetical protein